jgi:phosphatidylethanolamine/phosphatidyl-N-methylethanolamine N-methyltransferase
MSLQFEAPDTKEFLSQRDAAKRVLSATPVETDFVARVYEKISSVYDAGRLESIGLPFLRQFLASHVETGAVASSSQGLAELITDFASLDKANVVIELGPGTGVFTEKILEKMRDNGIFFALEINPRFVEATRVRCPQCRVLHDSAAHARKHLNGLGIQHCDSVVSGLPWAAFPEDLQDEILDAVVDVLKPGGTFVTFAYLPGLLLQTGKRFGRKLCSRFSQVERSPTVWRNIPPAFVYRAIK